MAHGAFGAMGGLQTSANDYAKYVAFLLSAWPPRDGAEPGPVKRASVRELSQGANFPSVRLRPGASGPDACREASTYGMGMYAATDCELGLTLEPRRRLSRLRLARAGAAGLRRGHLRAVEPHLCRAARAGVGRGRGAAPRRVARRPTGDGVAGAGHGVRCGRHDLHVGVGHGGRRHPGHELPDGPGRRPLGARVGGAQGQVGTCDTSVVDRAHRRAVRRLHVALRARAGARRRCCSRPRPRRASRR